MGWAIASVSGSSFNIDISYESPHIEYAINLGKLLNFYKCSIMVSSELYQMLSSFCKKHFRPVDVIKINDKRESITI